MGQDSEKKESSDINSQDGQVKREDNDQPKQQTAESSAGIPKSVQSADFNIETTSGTSGFDEGSTRGSISSSSQRRSSSDQVPTEVLNRPKVIIKSASEFPFQKLQSLDEKVNQTRWVVPVLPGQELEDLLDAAIALSELPANEQSYKNDLNIELPIITTDLICEPCQRFYREGLVVSFQKIYSDDAVHNWKSEIHRFIFENSRRFVHLAALKVPQDIYPVIELLSYVLNPQSRFHIVTAVRPSLLLPPARSLPTGGGGIGIGGGGIGGLPPSTGSGSGSGLSPRLTSPTPTLPVPTSTPSTASEQPSDADAAPSLLGDSSSAFSASPSGASASASSSAAPEQPSPPPPAVPAAVLEHKFARQLDARTQKCTHFRVFQDVPDVDF